MGRRGYGKMSMRDDLYRAMDRENTLTRKFSACEDAMRVMASLIFRKKYVKARKLADLTGSIQMWTEEEIEKLSTEVNKLRQELVAEAIASKTDRPVQSHPYYALRSVCMDCAGKAGFVRRKKTVGVWDAKCDVCGEVKATCDLSHDYLPKGKS